MTFDAPSWNLAFAFPVVEASGRGICLARNRNSTKMRMEFWRYHKLPPNAARCGERIIQ
jgi:hypothetical protein